MKFTNEEVEGFQKKYHCTYAEAYSAVEKKSVGLPTKFDDIQDTDVLDTLAGLLDSYENAASDEEKQSLLDKINQVVGTDDSIEEYGGEGSGNFGHGGRPGEVGGSGEGGGSSSGTDKRIGAGTKEREVLDTIDKQLASKDLTLSQRNALEDLHNRVSQKVLGDLGKKLGGAGGSNRGMPSGQRRGDAGGFVPDKAKNK